MERVAEIDRGIARERERLAVAYAELRAACGADERAFAARWRATAEAERFDDLNELIPSTTSGIRSSATCRWTRARATTSTRWVAATAAPCSTRPGCSSSSRRAERGAR